MVRRTFNRQDFVAAGTALVNEHGSTALTARALGEMMQADASALYRHFTGIDEIATEIIDQMFLLIVEAPIPDGSPRERIAALACTTHRVMLEHPNILGLVPSTTGQTPNGDRLTRITLQLLRDLGLEGENLVACLQMFESAVAGSHLFDLAGSPHHLEIRRQRRRRLEDPLVDDWSRSAGEVEHLNERAFQLLLEAMLDRCEALVRSQH